MADEPRTDEPRADEPRADEPERVARTGPRPPWVIAHRGASAEHPENTAPALRRARALGVDWIEVDVRLSRDGVVVLHHDADLRRSAGSAARVRDLTLAELRDVRLRYPGHEEARVLTLEEAVAAARPVPLCVEVKSDGPDDEPTAREGDAELDALVDGAMAAIAATPLAVLISFDDRVVRRARLHLPPGRVGLIRNLDRGPDAWRETLRADAGIAVLSRKVTGPDVVAAVLDAGRQAWAYALDDAETARCHAEWGVDGLITNRPHVILRSLGRGTG